MELRCVQCGFPVKSLFIQYSPGNIRLMKCENCREVADEYIECEFMIILIDLILHKPRAYRHVLYNVLNRETLNMEHLLWKSVVGYFFLDAYRSLLLKGKAQRFVLSQSFLSISTELLLEFVLGNLLFILSFVLAMRILLNISSEATRLGNPLLAVLVSSYLKIFLVTMMVWDFPTSVIFIIDLFVMTSNSVALQVMTDSAMTRCVSACIVAHAVKFLAVQALEFNH